MATKPTKRQTRRSISVRGLTYQRLRDYCDAMGCSVSGYLEEVIAEKLDVARAPVPTKALAPPAPSQGSSPEPANPEDIVSQHFTF